MLLTGSIGIERAIPDLDCGPCSEHGGPNPKVFTNDSRVISCALQGNIMHSCPKVEFSSNLVGATILKLSSSPLQVLAHFLYASTLLR